MFSLILDTGDAGFGILHTKAFTRAAGEEWLQVVQTMTVVDINGRHEVRLGKPRQPINIAGITYREMTLTEGSVNAIGLGVLANYRVVLDFCRRRIYLTPRVLVVATPRTTSGMTVEYIDGHTIVATVSPRGAAEAAEIKVGDELLEVDHCPIAGRESWQLGQFLNPPTPRSVELLIRRDGREYRKSVLPTPL